MKKLIKSAVAKIKDLVKKLDEIEKKNAPKTTSPPGGKGGPPAK